jgi:extracellular elastinolytic metalloproteinase
VKEDAMSKEFDAREQVEEHVEPRRTRLLDAADAASAVLPGAESVHVASFDARTGNPAVIVTEDAEPGSDDYVRRALEHVHRLGGALGLAPSQPPEFAPDPAFQRASSGAVAVHLGQQYKGIAIYEASETVRFDPEGRLTEVAGRSHTVEGDVSVAPALTPREALERGAAYVAQEEEDPPLDPFGQPLADPPLDLSRFAPQQLMASGGRPDAATTFSAPPFDGPVEVTLLWFPLGGDLRLTWHMVLQIPLGGAYRVLVDAGDGRLLLCRQLRHAIVGRATVFLRDGGQPAETLDLPLELERYGLSIPDDLPNGFPDDWFLGDSTDGANVRASLPDGTVARGRSSAGSVVFDPVADPQADDALVVNLFVLNGLMHDVCYLLGFREADGNFQRSNVGRGGLGMDAVRALVHPGAVWGTANMATPPDGRAPEMNMGLVTSTGRHTALDGDVVIHEYTHGVTNRLVGGPMNSSALDGKQSGGMGEGWGDYFACLLNGRETVGSWVVGRPGGIRLHPYTEDYPGTFGDLGRGAYIGVHAVGEVWCATLLAMGRRIGSGLAAQLVVDSLKLSAANPSFLAMRDAILVAARDHATSRGLDEHASAELTHRIWEAFARFGMGPGARTNGDTLTGIVADTSLPPRPERRTPTMVTASAAPELRIPDNDPTGVVSTIDLAADGAIADVQVSVDIRHSYRGDLVVRLVAPDGRAAVLSDRAGGSADDLEATFTAADVPDLAALAGRPAGGRWRLHVADRARRDVGVLRAWELAVAVGAPRAGATVSVEPGLPIPDDDPAGVGSESVLQAEGAVRALVLDVDVTHTYIGDLVVALTGPSGQTATVHDRAGGGTDNLITAYRSGAGEPLEAFVGEPAAGTWCLTVADHAGQDVGKLNRWRLAVEL